MAEALDIKRETYLAIVLDRESNGPAVICSPCGGMDIEEVAENNPEKILKVIQLKFDCSNTVLRST